MGTVDRRVRGLLRGINETRLTVTRSVLGSPTGTSRVRLTVTPSRALMCRTLTGGPMIGRFRSPGILRRGFLGTRFLMELRTYRRRRFPDHCGEGQVRSQHLDDGVVEDLGVVAVGEPFPRSRVGEPQGGLVPVDLQYLGVAAEDHPRDTSAVLHGLEHLRPLATQGRDVDGTLGTITLVPRGLLRRSRGGTITAGLVRGLLFLRLGLLALFGRRAAISRPLRSLGMTLGAILGGVWLTARFVAGLVIPTAGARAPGRTLCRLGTATRRDRLLGRSELLRTFGGAGDRLAGGRALDAVGLVHRTRDADPALQALQTGMDAAAPGVSRREQDPRAHQLQVKPGSSGAAHVRQSGGQNLRGTGELAGTEAGYLVGQPGGLLRRDVDEAGPACVWDGRDDDEITHPAQQVLGKAARILPHLDDLVNGGEDLVGVPGCEGVNDLVEEGFGGVTEQGCRLLIADVAIGGAAE